MLASVLAKTLYDKRRSFVWWCVGILAFVALYGAVYPSISGQTSLEKLINSYPQALKGFIGFGGNLDFISGAGYLGSEVFSFWGPVVLLAAAIAAGSSAIAGEEERGTLDLLLSLPLSRTRLLLEKLGALVVEVVALGAWLWILLVIVSAAAGMGVSAWNLGAATLSLVLLALVFGTISLAIGAATGKRGLAIGLAAALAVAADVLNALAPLANWLSSAKMASLYYYYSHGDPLRHGFQGADTLVLVAAVLVISAAAPFLLRRRDLSAP